MSGGRKKIVIKTRAKINEWRRTLRAYRPLKLRDTILEPALFSLRANSEAEKER